METSDDTISSTIYTHVNWLQAYTKALNEATDEQKLRENREFYTHESQIYPDYLDYKENWEYATEQMIQDTRKSYIYRMAAKHQKLQCKCGEIHILALYPSEDASLTIVDDPREFILKQCWFQTIDAEMHSIKINLERGGANFPNVISRHLTQIMRWKIAKTGNSPTLLPYDTYKEVWWDLDISGRTTDTACKVLSLMIEDDRAIILRKEEEIRRPVHAHYFFPTEEIRNDHSFHLLYRARDKDMGEILKFLNYGRRKSGWYGETLKKHDIEESILHCILCEAKEVKPEVSVFGIYCAPPAAGKTTAMERGLLIGIDTDWIGIGLTWRDYSPILRKGIPIITNQTHLFQGSGIKIQLMLKKHIRLDAKGRPMGNYREILSWAKQNENDVTLHKMRSSQYVSDFVTRATILAHMQNVGLFLFLNGKSIWDASDGSPQWMNEFGRKMRRLAIGTCPTN